MAGRSGNFRDSINGGALAGPQCATTTGRMINAQITQADAKPVDMHVHIVGNGLGGSGCWLRVEGWHKPMAAFMLKHIGLPVGALGKSNFDELYVENLLRLVRGSSLGGIVILAQDQVYQE